MIKPNTKLYIMIPIYIYSGQSDPFHAFHLPCSCRYSILKGAVFLNFFLIFIFLVQSPVKQITGKKFYVHVCTAAQEMR